METNNGKLFWKRMLSGFIIGLGFIIPGVSGGIIAVTLGLYERMISAITHFFRDAKKNFWFLLPLAIGGGVGVLLAARLITFLMAHWKTPVLLLFMGLVLGGTPGIIREAHQGGDGRPGGFRPRYLWAAFGGLLLFSALAFGETFFNAGTATDGTFGFLDSFFSGIVVALGSVIPGVSSSFLLMLFHWFEPFMAAVSALDIVTLLPAGVSAVVTALALLRLVHYVFAHVRGYAYYVVTGFTVGTAVYLLYEIAQSGFIWWHALFFIIGVVAGYLAARPNAAKN